MERGEGDPPPEAKEGEFEYEASCWSKVKAIRTQLSKLWIIVKAKFKDIRRKKESTVTPKKPRILCLHGCGENAVEFKEFFKNWPDYVVEKMDLVFIDGPFTYNDGASAKHFQWFTRTEDKTIDNFDKGIAYIEDRMIELGPFDGVLGFSMGAVAAATLPGMQEHGVCLTKVGKIKHVILIAGGKLGGRKYLAPKLAETAFLSPIKIPSLHIFGENDHFARATAQELVEAYEDPSVIYHHGGHEVPKLDEDGLKIMFEFLKKINAIV